MFDHMNGVMQGLAKKKTQWMEDLYFAVKVAPQKLSKYYCQVTPTTSLLLIPAHIVDSFHKLQSWKKWDTAMDINREDETSYTTQYQKALVKWVEKDYCAKHEWMSVIRPNTVLHTFNIASAKASGFGQSWFDP